MPNRRPISASSSGIFLHSLRCVLDHLIWQLALLNGQKPSYRNQFPITNTPEAFVGATDSLRGVASEHQTLIERFLPSHVDGGNPSQHMLAVLRDLSNIDKHDSYIPCLSSGMATPARSALRISK